MKTAEKKGQKMAKKRVYGQVEMIETEAQKAVVSAYERSFSTPYLNIGKVNFDQDSGLVFLDIRHYHGATIRRVAIAPNGVEWNVGEGE